MNISPSWIERTTGFVLRRRWLLMLFISFVVIGLELYEHWLDDSMAQWQNYYFLRETVLLGLVMPLTGGLVLSVFSRERQQHAQADLQRELSQRLTHVDRWDTLARLLVEIPNAIAPLSDSELFLYDAQTGHFVKTAEWHAHSVTLPTGRAREHEPGLSRLSTSSVSSLSDADANAMQVVDRVGLATHSDCANCAGSATQLDACVANVVLSKAGVTQAGASDLHALVQHDAENSYCLPLVHGNEPIALLHFAVAHSAPLTAEQRRLFNNLVPAMTLAIEAARPQRSAFIKAEATEAERRRVAQELHDSLAQNIAYLRLKLDQLSGEDALTEIAAVQRQLEQMRDVADQAYQEVRGTLVKLHTEHAPDFQTALLSLVNAFRERTTLQVQLSSAGLAVALPPDQERQALYILREGLINVEKHAAADVVTIDVLWGAETLRLTLQDNGHGFEPAHARRDGHFGLGIMQERARSLGADLLLTSAPGQGTRLTLSIPLDGALVSQPERSLGG